MAPAASASVKKSSKAGAQPLHFVGLDGLRALAAAAVLIYHAFPGWMPGGFIGVDVFFVISGFLITSLLVREFEQRGSLRVRRFWVRRMRRLVPAMATTALVTTAIAFTVGGDILVNIGRNLLGALTFSTNWLDIWWGNNYFNHMLDEIFRNYWSLGVEFQFYLVWPLLLILFLKKWPSAGWRIFTALCMAAASGWLMFALVDNDPSNPTRAYFGTDTHSFGLFIGAALALWLMRKPATAAPKAAHNEAATVLVGAGGLIVLLLFGISLNDNSLFPYRGGFVLVSIITAGVVWAATRPDSRLGKMLDCKPLAWLGQRSYSIYLWHWPLYAIAGSGLSLQFAHQYAVAIGCVVAVVSTLVAAASYRWIETPIRRYGFATCAQAVWRAITPQDKDARPVEKKRHRMYFAASAALAVILVLDITAVATAPTVTSAEASILAGQKAIAEAQKAATQSPTPTTTTPTPTATRKPTQKPKKTTPASPVPPPPPSGSSIDVIGDSVTLASASGLLAQFPGVNVDGKVSRSITTAPGIIQTLGGQGQLRPIIVIGLATNGGVTTAWLDKILALTGPHRLVVFVNARGDRSWIGPGNTLLAQYVAQHSTQTALADWADAIAPHLDDLAGDGIHPGPAGGKIYAECIADAITSFYKNYPGQAAELGK